jgi:hypothetical protein
MPGIEIQKLCIYYIAIQRIGICVDRCRCIHDLSLMERYYFRTRGPPLFSSSSVFFPFSSFLSCVGFGSLALVLGLAVWGLSLKVLSSSSSLDKSPKI